MMLKHVARTLAITALLVCGMTPAAKAEDRREIAFPDWGEYRTLKCDFHTHTVFSDGLVWPTVRVDEAWREGLDAIAITDHIEYRPHREEVKGDFNRSYEIARDAARQRNILVIPGAEITRDTPPGHFNALFLSDANALDVKDFYEAFEQAGRQGAFIFWNHPGWQGPERGKWAEAQTRLFEKKQLHGVEICNGPEYYGEAHGEATNRQMTFVGNSDIHDPSLGLMKSLEDHRTLTLVFARERSIEAIKEALFAGRTAVWCKNKLYGREACLSPLFAASVQVSPPYLREKDAVWVEIRNTCETDLVLQGDSAANRGTIPLWAKSVVRAKLSTGGDTKTVELPYKVTNWLVGPDKPLVVKLVIKGD